MSRSRRLEHRMWFTSQTIAQLLHSFCYPPAVAIHRVLNCEAVTGIPDVTWHTFCGGSHPPRVWVKEYWNPSCMIHHYLGKWSDGFDILTSWAVATNVAYTTTWRNPSQTTFWHWIHTMYTCTPIRLLIDGWLWHVRKFPRLRIMHICKFIHTHPASDTSANEHTASFMEYRQTNLAVDNQLQLQ